MPQLPTVVLLAAGDNTRFFPLNSLTHKSHMTLLGKPIIVRTLESLERHGFTHVVVVTSKADAAAQQFNKLIHQHNLSIHAEIVVQETATGMGDALLAASNHISGDFCVISPSAIHAGEVLETLIAKSTSGGAIAVSETSEPWLYGIVTLQNNRITSIIEKPKRGEEPSNYKVHGVYFLTQNFLQILKQTPPEQYNFETALGTYFAQSEVAAVTHQLPLLSLKYPWHLFHFQANFFNQLQSYTSPDAQIAPTASFDTSSGPIVISAGATISHCARLVGPVFVGKNAFVGDFTLIRHSSIEANSRIGPHSDVTRSIILQDSSMHSGFLGDTIVGQNVKIGTGFVTSNKRLDRQPITVQVKDKTVEVGRGFGTVIGHNSNIGIRVSTMPGKLIGSNCVLFPAVTVWANQPHDTLLKPPHQNTTEHEK